VGYTNAAPPALFKPPLGIEVEKRVMVGFFCLLCIAVGAGFLFLAFDKHSRREQAEQHWLWRFARNAEDEETAEAMVILGTLLAGTLIISGAVLCF